MNNITSHVIETIGLIFDLVMHMQADNAHIIGIGYCKSCNMNIVHYYMNIAQRTLYHMNKYCI